MSTSGYSSSEAASRAAVVEIRRFVNDEIYRVARDLDRVPNRDSADEFEFVCECGQLACTKFVSMRLADFEQSKPGSVVAH
jgi:hypothetical protein